MLLIINDKSEITDFSYNDQGFGTSQNAIKYSGNVPNVFLANFKPSFYLLKNNQIVANPNYVAPQLPDLTPISTSDFVKQEDLANYALKRDVDNEVQPCFRWSRGDGVIWENGYGPAYNSDGNFLIIRKNNGWVHIASLIKQNGVNGGSACKAFQVPAWAVPKDTQFIPLAGPNDGATEMRFTYGTLGRDGQFNIGAFAGANNYWPVTVTYEGVDLK